jgi:hypothetical protein
MPTIPIRGVGGLGVIADVNPQDAPEIAWTDARNIRFSNGSLSRSPVFKKISSTYTYSKQPVGIINGWDAGKGSLVTVFSDGSMEEFRNGVISSVTPSGTLGTSTSQVTTCVLGGVTYVNRESDIPSYRKDPTEGAFKPLTGWTSTDRCRSLRSYKDFLIALDVTKISGDYLGMVKWSDAAQSGAPPTNWDTADPASLAGESVLNDIKGRIIDGRALGDSFIIYGEDQTYRMDFIGAPFVFAFSMLFSDQGLMSKNCVTAVDGKHYVFGRSDIFVHDGIQKLSIVDSKISNKIFSELDHEFSDRCFTYHNKSLHEIMFCYPTTSEDAPWRLDDISGCNRSAVYNYKDNTWSFIDIPSLISATEVQITSETTWDSFSSWNIADAPWSVFSGLRPKSLTVCSTGHSGISKAATSYYVDPIIGGTLPFSPDPDLIWDAYAESLNRDLDEIAPTLYGRKATGRATPQYRVYNDEHQFQMQIGHSNDPTSDVTWSPIKTFTGYTSAKYDQRSTGRYISVRIIIPSGSYAEFSGFDLDVNVISGR